MQLSPSRALHCFLFRLRTDQRSERIDGCDGEKCHNFELQGPARLEPWAASA